VDDAIYVDGRRISKPRSLGQTYAELRALPEADHAFCWIGLLRPSTEEIQTLGREFDLHPLAMEDAIHAHQRPKLERYGSTLFVVLRPAWYVDETEDVELGEIHLFPGPDFALVLRHAARPALAGIRSRLEADPEHLRAGPFAVLHAVLDRVVDEYSPVLDGLRTDIDQIEVQVFDGDPAVSRRIYQLSREVIELQRAVEPLRDVLHGLRGALRDASPGSERELELSRRLRDVDDHVTRAVERVQSYRELLATIVSVNSALVGQRQNEEMTRLTQAGFDQNEQVKRLTSIAAMLYAPTVVAAIYGMNFDHMPELHWAFGYPYALGVMVLLGLVLWGIFRWRRWL
jgi:magnesium transporter